MSESKVLDFTKRRRSDVIGCLEELLDRARAGDITTIAAVTLTTEGRVDVDYTPTQWLGLAGATAQLHHAVMANPEEWD